jgi:hypothetical protein
MNGGFRNFRDWLISEGREIFERALANPESLADLERVDQVELEAFGYVASQLYKNKTGRDPQPNFLREPVDPVGVPWEEEGVTSLFPRLAANICSDSRTDCWAAWSRRSGRTHLEHMPIPRYPVQSDSSPET